MAARMVATCAKPRVAIIGAGPAGLCALKHMVYNYPNKFNPVSFETQSRAGGVWLYSNDSSRSYSAIYDSMRTNIPKEIMPYEGFPFPNQLPSYVHHSDFLKYLENFMHHYELEPYIQFNTKVTKIVPNRQPSCLGTAWDVTAQNLETGQAVTNTYDAVVVCNGHYAIPHKDIIGIANFNGTIMHSQKYRNPKPFESQNVLVVGGGASGRDIAVEIATTAKQVFLSQKRAKMIVSASVPSNLKLSPGTSCIDKDGLVLFDNGDRLRVDAIVLCTGYEYDFPFLSKECGVSVTDHRVQPLYKHIFNIQHPSMIFLGLNLKILPLLNFDVQTKLVCAVLSGSIKLPDKDAMMEDEERDFQERLRNGLLPRDAHFLGGSQFQYYKTLAEIGEFDCYEEILEKIYTHVGHLRTSEAANYKNYNCVIIDRQKGTFDLIPIIQS